MAYKEERKMELRIIKLGRIGLNMLKCQLRKIN
jgi:hypothetical protein